LVAKGIPLKTSAGEGLTNRQEQQINIERVFRDIKYERVPYGFIRIKPLLYFGREHAVFKQDLFREESSILQYGFLCQKGKFDLRGLTRGKSFDNYDLKLKWIGLTSNLDLIGKAHYKETPTQEIWGYGIDLRYYQPAFTFTIGLADFAQTPYLHKAGTVDIDWGKHQLAGEIDLYTPFSGKELTFANSKYVAAQWLKISLRDDFSLQPKLMVSNTEKADLFAHPLIFRGVVPEEGEDQTLIQSSLEIAYHYRFPYSLELLQCIQLKELTWFSFTDLYYRLEPDYAVGAGLTCELSLLGIKPSSFGGYVVYDLKEASWRGVLSLDLAL